MRTRKPGALITPTKERVTLLQRIRQGSKGAQSRSCQPPSLPPRRENRGGEEEGDTVTMRATAGNFIIFTSGWIRLNTAILFTTVESLNIA